MKTRLTIYLGLLMAASFLSSCEKIPPIGDRNLPPIDTVGAENNDTTTLSYQQKSVLIEEFTGVTCNNCPLAATEIKSLESTFPGRVVTVGVHASNFAVPTSSYPADFRTTAGNEIYVFANPFGVPSGLIDRADQGTSGFAKPYLTFGSEVQQILQQDTAEISIKQVHVLDTSNNTLDVTVTFSNQLELINAPDKYWVAYLTESKIIAAQKLPDNTKDDDYEHNHVLRTALNGAFGTQLSTLDNSQGSTASVSGTFTLDPSWVASNCEVVVFVYDNSDYSVIQANGKKVN